MLAALLTKRVSITKLSLLRRQSQSSKFLPKMPTIKAALIDLSGTLHVEDEATPCAVEALKELRQTGITIRFVTNTTKESTQTLYQRLRRIGFEMDPLEIYSSLSAASEYVKLYNMNPYYLLSEDARKDFPPHDPKRKFDAVVVGLAPTEFNYEKLNDAFNVLMACSTHKFMAVHEGKYYKRADGLALGPGLFVKGLEYATGRQAIIVGKPNPYFYERAIPNACRAEEVVMIGDDVNDDIDGAMKLGCQGILVKTGKYLPDVALEKPPTALLENFSEAVKWIIQTNKRSEPPQK